MVVGELEKLVSSPPRTKGVERIGLSANLVFEIESG